MTSEVHQKFQDVPGMDLWEYDNGNSEVSYWVRPGAILRISVQSENFRTWDLKMSLGMDTHVRSKLQTREIPALIEKWNAIYTLWAVHFQ